jgi:hypothetical protein
MASKLTTLAQKRQTLDYQLLSRKSTDWLKDQVKSIRNPRRVVADIVKEKQRSGGRFMTGGLYFFCYDPKYANTLPYYDMFPLVLVLEKYPDGFMGLNLHYLPIPVRAAFLDQLLDYAYYNDEDEITRMKVTYNILNASRRLKAFGPCLKRYLYNHTTSRLLKVEPHEWETALFLPVEQFQKANKRTVFAESVQEMNKV